MLFFQKYRWQGQANYRLGIGLALTALIVVSGCSQKGADTASEQGESAAGGTTEAAAFGGSPGDRAPDFSLMRLAGGTLSLGELQGKLVIVDFWDTWCGPCRIALPHLQALSEAYASDLVVVGVAMGQEGEAKVRQYVSQQKLTFEMVLYDPESSVVADFGGLRGIPTTFLIGTDGIILEKWVGAKSQSVYEKAVKAALAPSGPADS